MKILLFFCLFIFSVRAEDCNDNAMAVLSPSSPNQQHFIERGFLPKLYSELIEIVRINKIKIENEEVKKILLQWDNDARNPRIVNLFKIANFFGVSVSDLFKHYGKLGDFIDPASVVNQKKLLTPEKEGRISERIHLHLSGLINETLLKKNLTLKKLAFQTGIKIAVFDHITIKARLPRLPSLLHILVRLDADVVDFFRRVESSLEQEQLPRYFRKNAGSSHTQHERSLELEEYTVKLIDTIRRGIKEILEDMSKQDRNSNIIRFKNKFAQYDYDENRRLKRKSKRRIFRLEQIFQTARMLGIYPSEVLKYAEDLKLHANLADIKTKTLLSDEKILKLSNSVREGLSAVLKKSGIKREELAEASQLSLRYLEDIGTRKNPSFSSLESILRALGSDTIRFFEELELSGKLNLEEINLSSANTEIESELSNQTMGARISQIREILPISSYRFNQIVFSRSNSTMDLPQRDVLFKTLYKTSRFANLSLSNLTSAHPIETLLDLPMKKIEKIPHEEVKRAEKVLIHLLLSEARRQRDVHGLTVMGLAIRSHLRMRYIRKVLSGEIIPKYSKLHQIVEKGMGIPISHFFEDFEEKLKSFDRIPFAPKRIALELEGLYFSKRIKTQMKKLQERFDLALEFVKSSNTTWEELNISTGIQFRFYKKKKNLDYFQVSTIIKFCHFFGISMRDFLGKRNFSELTTRKKFNFERLPKDRLLGLVANIKRKAGERRKSLDISMRDLEILIGAPPVEKELVNSLFSESVLEFSWYRYFQLAEIFSRKSEDDFFLLDGTDL